MKTQQVSADVRWPEETVKEKEWCFMAMGKGDWAFHPQKIPLRQMSLTQKSAAFSQLWKNCISIISYGKQQQQNR